MAFLTDTQMAATAVTDPTPARGEPQQLAANTLFAGRYRIEHRLGAGGMGTVFAARDTLTDQAVAIKLVAGHRTQIERVHLREEVRATMLLTHRNIARTYTLGEVDGEIFIVMELLEGETLAKRIARGPIPRAETLAIIHQLIDALAEAHRHSIVHCDVKPANIMCCPDGRVVLMDFGLARVEDPDASAHTTTIRGTPAYMAPEVVSGRRADARADIYAVGLILFEMLTGEPPFKARSIDELLDSQLYATIDTRALDPVLAAAIRGATAKDPAQRFANLDELRAAFIARPPRSKKWLGAIAAVIGLVIGFACVRLLVPHSDAVAKPSPNLVMQRELELRRMLKGEILVSMQELQRRACACPGDAACGRRVLADLVALGKRTQPFDTDIDEATHATSAKLAVCLLQTGVSELEFLDVVRQVKGLPVDTAPREGAW